MHKCSSAEETKDATPSPADEVRDTMSRNGDLPAAADAGVTLERELTILSEGLRRLTKACVAKERQDKV